MTGGDGVRVNFDALDFSFTHSSYAADECQWVGYAPEGRVGVVEVLRDGDEREVSLLVSTSDERDTRYWSALCVGSLATALEVDFPLWLGEQVRRRGSSCAWSATRQFGDADVSANFYPADSLLITVGRAGASKRPTCSS